jgi:membrane-associated phospholipid phosphatase
VLAALLALSLAPPEPADNVSVELAPVEIVAAPHEPPSAAPPPELEPAQVEAAPLPEPAPSEQPRAPLPDIRFRLDIDLPLFVGFAAVWGVTEGFKAQVAPRECRWCTPGPVARASASATVWRNPEAAALTSDIVAYAGIPVTALTLTLIGVARAGEWRKIHEDLLVALEAVALTAALTNGIKMATARARPYAVHAPEPIPFAEDPDQNLSFPSGHTSFAFALATSFASVATLRGRKLAPLYWSLGVPAAAFVGYLRMAGDRHWLGDVLLGAGLGTLVGVGMPWLFHHPRTGLIPRKTKTKAKMKQARSISVMPAPRGLSIAVRF